MSLQDFLREGQEAPYRILSRLSQLFHSLSLSLLDFPASSSSGKDTCRVCDDEILQEEGSSLCAADIESELKKQFAFLPGGRGRNCSPVIVFPEFPAFDELQESEFHNVLTYLTSIPSISTATLGFILVIDRRLDKWTSVKATLLRIASSFPGNLEVVLVLRPTNLLHRTFSDLYFMFNKDEFKMKVPVIMLSSVTELHSFIDRTQLTQELGGTQEYCHEKWISHRTAIEGFALMVKMTAQSLQSFGTELAETELPKDIQATNDLLDAHTEKKDKMKKDLVVALSQGTALLESINEPLLKEPDYSMDQDELENLSTVQRLLSQLDETEVAFDVFWERHHTKLEQCLLLRHFEHKFQEVRAQLDLLAEYLKGPMLSEIAIGPAHVEHMLRDVSSHEEKVCGCVLRAQELACQGDQLIESFHYAMDSILLKCRELRATSEDLSSDLKAKKTHLLKAMELHQNLEKVAKWCEDGIYLLASQPVDKCQSQEGAESALQELEHYLSTRGQQSQHIDRDIIWRDYDAVLNGEFRDHVEKVLQKQVSMEEMFDKRRVSLKKLATKQTRPVQPVAPSPEASMKPTVSSPVHLGPEKITSDANRLNGMNYTKVELNLQFNSKHGSISEEEDNLAILRRHVMNELLETERMYVEELLCVLQGYAAEMDNPAMIHLIPSVLLNKKDVLFGNMPEIYQFHKRNFLKELETYTECPELVGRCFLQRMTDLQIYEKYCQNKPRSESLWRQCSDCAFFQECQKKLEHKLGLDSYLLKPVQRITKYQLLLRELIKYSKGCEGAEDLQEALSAILGILKAVNDSMHLIAITGYEGDLSNLGRLLMQGSFSVWIEHKKAHAKVKDLARFKPMQRHLFLHEKALLFCKRREESGEGYEKAPSYSFKHSLNMSAVGITENVKGDSKKFEIWSNSREEVYIAQAPTADIKTAWVNEIRKVLTGQLKACKDASQQRSPEQLLQSLAVTPATANLSPLKSNQKSIKKGEEKKVYDAESNTSPSHHTDKVKGSPTSPENKIKLHEIKSDLTPFRDWPKASTDASEDNDDSSSTEDPLNSDPEDEGGKKLSPGKYTVEADYDSGEPQDVSVKSGDMVQLVKEGDDGQWFVCNLTTNKEGWIPASNLAPLLEQSKSVQSLSSSEGSGSGDLSTSSSCSETYTSFSDIKA
ncbi:guanine nucleotide exchange factor DBS-like isoform X4 [Brienomyrus brachyistius]|uniref:guanine nucleotide exchange factor DBS-like isoform X4 n=1 Tax=Brienomyrus brachyistius TaxID=42636 RepID=UPI0020B3736B|nr:guanine nucleotide exchange factor DBS-like isoform X4 [Brienomyrus brachyistius]